MESIFFSSPARRAGFVLLVALAIGACKPGPRPEAAGPVTPSAAPIDTLHAGHSVPT